MFVHINVYRELARDRNGTVTQIPLAPPVASYKLPILAEPTQSEPFPSHSAFIEIKTLEDCFVAFGTDPVAQNTSCFVEGGERLYFGVLPGTKISVISGDT